MSEHLLTQKLIFKLKFDPIFLKEYELLLIKKEQGVEKLTRKLLQSWLNIVSYDHYRLSMNKLCKYRIIELTKLGEMTMRSNKRYKNPEFRINEFMLNQSIYKEAKGENNV